MAHTLRPFETRVRSARFLTFLGVMVLVVTFGGALSLRTPRLEALLRPF